jgi:SnoaL-like domain
MTDEPRLELQHAAEGESAGDLAATLPASVAAYIQATNSCDLDALLATFVDDALVNDQLQDYWGKEAIAAWAARDIVGERMTLKVANIIQHYGHSIVTAHVDGLFDKRGLPDPLVLAFYFSSHDGKIVQLIILRNQSGT